MQHKGLKNYKILFINILIPAVVYFPYHPALLNKNNESKMLLLNFVPTMTKYLEITSVIRLNNVPQVVAGGGSLLLPSGDDRCVFLSLTISPSGII